MNILAIIDIDGLFYHCSKDDAIESIIEFDKRMQNILTKTKATHYVAFCSYAPYFRNKIDSLYKASRKPTTLKWVGLLKKYAKVMYQVQSLDLVEADDLCAYWINNKIVSRTPEGEHIEFDEKVLCSPDKDLLQGNAGRHFNYTYKLEEYKNPDSRLIEGWFVETSEDYAERFFLEQLVVGDSADGVKGIEGRGKKYFEKLIKENKDLSLAEIFHEYGEKYGHNDSGGLFQFSKNSRLLKLLKTDKDFINEIGEIPDLPNIVSIQIPENTNKEDEITFD